MYIILKQVLVVELERTEFRKCGDFLKKLARNTGGFLVGDTFSKVPGYSFSFFFSEF